jgi:hypothetical protein
MNSLNPHSDGRFGVCLGFEGPRVMGEKGTAAMALLYRSTTSFRALPALNAGVPSPTIPFR